MRRSASRRPWRRARRSWPASGVSSRRVSARLRSGGGSGSRSGSRRSGSRRTSRHSGRPSSAASSRRPRGSSRPASATSSTRQAWPRGTGSGARPPERRADLRVLAVQAAVKDAKLQEEYTRREHDTKVKKAVRCGPGRRLLLLCPPLPSRLLLFTRCCCCCRASRCIPCFPLDTRRDLCDWRPVAAAGTWTLSSSARRFRRTSGRRPTGGSRR